jgi:hypothetical protein
LRTFVRFVRFHTSTLEVRKGVEGVEISLPQHTPLLGVGCGGESLRT